MTLTRKDLSRSIHKETGFTEKFSIEIIESVIEMIKSTLDNGDDVLISGFGKFCVKEKNARRGRNPAAEKEMMLRPRTVVTFKCSGKLRNLVNG